jgi:hypothetical protein
MSSRLTVVLNGHTYTRNGMSWVDETGTMVPTYLLPALNAAVAANTAPAKNGLLNKSRTGSKRR